MDTDQLADVVQPDVEGQGDGGASDAPYAEYLNRLPEEVRGDVEPVFRDWDANTTRRFQEAAEYRKSWEPYEQLGVNQLAPDEMQWLLQFRDAHENNPEAIVEWAKAYADQHGLTLAEQLEQDAQQQSQDSQPFDEFAPAYDTQAIEKVLQSQLSPIQQRLEAFAQWQEQQEYQSRLQEANQMVRTQLDELKQEHPKEFNEQMIEKLIPQYIESDPRNAVRRAFDDWQAIRSQIEKDAFQAKASVPAAAESGGLADGAPEEITTLAQAAEIARARLRQNH